MITKAEFQRYQSLKIKKYRDQYEEYLVEGFKMVEEVLNSGQVAVCLLVQGTVAEKPSTRLLMSMASKNSVPVEVMKDGEFEKISALETPPGVIAVVRKKKDYIEADKMYLVLDSIKDPGNLGAMIRTADWFGINNIVLGKESVDVYNSKVVQSSMGSLFRMNIVQNEDLPTFMEVLKANHYTIIATSLEGKPLAGSELKHDKLAVLVGNESTGLNPELLRLADHLYKIPGAGTAESLSVSVAAGIVLYQIFTQR